MPNFEEKLKEIRKRSHGLKKEIDKTKRSSWAVYKISLENSKYEQPDSFEAGDLHYRATKKFNRSLKKLKETQNKINNVVGELKHERNLISGTPQLHRPLDDVCDDVGTLRKSISQLASAGQETSAYLNEWKENIPPTKKLSIFYPSPYRTQEDRESADNELKEKGIQEGLEKAMRRLPY